MGNSRSIMGWGRLILLFAQLFAAFIVYVNFEHGVLVILAYILFTVNQYGVKQFVTTQETESIIHNARVSLGNHVNQQNRDLFVRIEKLEEQSSELESRVTDLEA